MNRKARMLAMYENQENEDDENSNPQKKPTTNASISKSHKRYRNESLNPDISNQSKGSSIYFSSENPFKTERKYIQTERKKILNSKKNFGAASVCSNSSGNDCKVFTVMFAQAQPSRVHKKYTHEGELRVDLNTNVCQLFDQEENIEKRDQKAFFQK